ncbi:nose resistant to fluoxetine protein 6-like isoform X2 [Lycorma delicatula]|uniref:nose resistant to fluoxetine protein 6-like isoform X2 n=1 Tax=Lycorma delicatula TaxID=130591 RepID=UPI003F51982D
MFNNLYVFHFFKFIFLLINLNNAEEITLTNHIYEDTALLMPKTLKSITQQIFENGNIADKILNFYTPVFANSTLCRDESEMYKNSLKNFDSWAVKMWDSSGKIPSGLMHAHFYDLGNFHECFEVPEISPYDVQYCTIEIKSIGPIRNTGFDWENPRELVLGTLSPIRPSLYLGRCLPASCDQNDLQIHFSKILEKSSLSVYIDNFSCVAENENERYILLEWIFMTYITLTVFLIIASAIIDYSLKSNNDNGIVKDFIQCYSLRKNLYGLFTVNEQNKLLKPLEGIRVISMTGSVLIHLSIIYFTLPAINYIDFQKVLTSNIFLYFLNVELAIDAFFIMSALLTIYKEIYNQKAGKKFDVSAYYISRFFRIYPALVFQKIVIFILYSHAIKSGPLVKHKAGTIKHTCANSVWTNLLFINNFVNLEEMCMTMDWYLAVDTQLYIISPLLIFPLIKWKVFRKIFAPLIILLSGLFTSYSSYINEYRAGSVYDRDLRTTKSFTLYFSTYGRIGVWVMGLYLGYLLYKIKERTSLRLSKLTDAISNFIIIYIVAFILYILMEAPFINIGKLIIKKKNSKMSSIKPEEKFSDISQNEKKTT